MLVYKRILVKVSGESLSDGGSGISNEKVTKLANTLKQVCDSGVEVGVVVGGGNFWRGRTSEKMDRATADYIGMLATVMNALALGEGLKAVGAKCKVVSQLAIDKAVETFNREKVVEYLAEGNIVVFGAGTGAPYFSTDTASSLKACEIHADALICMKNIDGIYDSDPKTNPNAKKFDTISYKEVLERNLKAFDLTAIAMCMEYNMPIVTFGMNEVNGLLRVCQGEKLGTIIK